MGDRITYISAYTPGIVVKIDDKGYYVDYPKGKGICYISFTLEKHYKLIPNKFDITTLKPFDKVLVRNDNSYWRIEFFERINKKNNKYPFVCMNEHNYKRCIPYKGNEHLLSTANDCEDFYKIWK